MKPLVSLIPERPEVETPARRALRKWEIAQIMHTQRGFCAGCGTKLYAGFFDADHIIPLACGGTNDLTNFQLLCKVCHAAKSRGEDIPAAAKIKRLRGETGQRARRERKGPTLRSKNTLGGEAYQARKAAAERMRRETE